MRGPGHLFQRRRGAATRRQIAPPPRYRFVSSAIATLLLVATFAGVIPIAGPTPVAASHTAMKLPFPSGAPWVVGQGYNTRPPDGTHWNCDPATLRDQPTRSESCRAHYQYKFALDLARADGATAGQPILAPTDGTIRWIDLSTGGMSIDLGDGYAFAFFHTNLAPGLDAGQRIQRGQRLATVAGPGQAANGGWPHLHVTLWQTNDGGNWSRIAVPFTDDHAFEGYDLPNLGESAIDQHRGRTLSSTNQQLGAASPGLSAPVLQSPATGTSYRTYAPRPQLIWSPVSGATQYQVVVNDGAMTSPWLSGTVWTMPVLTNGQYAWQVRARSSAGAGPLSPKWVIWVDTSNAAPPPTAPPSGALALSSAPSSGQVGSSFSLTASGFGAGETVRLYLDSASSSPIGSVAAQSNGSFATSVTLPNATSGAHRFVARGMSTGRVTTSLVTLSPSLDRTPYSGAPGAAVTVTVKGFGAYESVRLTWETASGAYLGGATTNAVGTGATTIRIPQGSQGWHDYVGTGSKSGGRGYGAIKITGPPPTGGGAATGGQVVGTGSYRITATREGLVGGTTSSGHVIVTDDHFVSLPACTATSCPWLTPGVRHDKWGLRVECGSRCYVRVKNVATGACSVAPIYDVGPWFTNDNWWDPASGRILNTLATTKTKLPQAYTGADAARDGKDVGYGLAPSGVGVSNKGYEVGNRASLDIADGTWVDIGLAMGAGIAPNGIVATMLWQSGEDPVTAARACGQPGPNAGKGSSPAPAPLPSPPMPSTPSAPSAPATLKSSATWAKVGQGLTLTGTGFRPGERVAIEWDGTTVATATPNGSGGFSLNLTVPAGAYGNHRFIARGASSGRSTKADIRVGASLTRMPASGKPGTQVRVVAAGFGAYEKVRLSWNGLSGASLGTISTNGQGTGIGTISIPDDSAGWHDYAGTGSRSGAHGFGAIQVLTASAAPTPKPASTSLGISTSPRAGTPGSFISVSVKGFNPGEMLQISWGEEGRYLGSIAADNRGTRTFAIPLPVRPQGVELLTVKGSSSARIVHSSVVIQPRLVLSPGSGPMRTDVTASGLGFSPNQAASVVWRKPGRSGLTVCSSRTDANGSFRCDFIAPGSTGTGTMYVTGLTTAAASTTAFLITSNVAAAEIGPEAGDGQTLATEPATAAPQAPRVSMGTPASGNRVLRGREADLSAAEVSTAAVSPTPSGVAATPGSTSGIRPEASPAPTPDRQLRSPTGTATPATLVPTMAASPAPAATPIDPSSRSVRSGDGTPLPAPTASPVADPTLTATSEKTEPRPLRTPAAAATTTAVITPTEAGAATETETDRSLRTGSEATPPALAEVVTEVVATPAEAAESNRSVRTVSEPPATESVDNDAQSAPTPEPASIPLPTETFTPLPTEVPTETPTEVPTEVPTDIPTEVPTDTPTEVPALEPITDQLVLVAASDVSLDQWADVGAATPTVLDPSGLVLPVGGPDGAVTYLTFQVEGVAAGTVLDARLILTGAGEVAGPGGAVTVLPGVWVDEWSATNESVPGPGAPALTGAGDLSEPVWWEPGQESAIDVTGVAAADGTITFVLTGTPDAVAGIASRESATPPRLVLTVVRPAS